jgi:hypothetical protein
VRIRCADHAKVGTNIADKRRSLGRYSSLEGLKHRSHIPNGFRYRATYLILFFETYNINSVGPIYRSSYPRYATAGIVCESSVLCCGASRIGCVTYTTMLTVLGAPIFTCLSFRHVSTVMFVYLSHTFWSRCTTCHHRYEWRWCVQLITSALS